VRRASGGRPSVTTIPLTNFIAVGLRSCVLDRLSGDLPGAAGARLIVKGTQVPSRKWMPQYGLAIGPQRSSRLPPSIVSVPRSDYFVGPIRGPTSLDSVSIAIMKVQGVLGAHLGPASGKGRVLHAVWSISNNTIGPSVGTKTPLSARLNVKDPKTGHVGGVGGGVNGYFTGLCGAVHRQHQFC